MIRCTTHYHGCPCREASHRETEAQRDQMAAALDVEGSGLAPALGGF